MTSTRRTTVLVVTTSYPLSADGSEAAGAFVSDFVTELRELADVRVVAPGITEGADSGAAVATWRFSAGGQPLSLLSPLKPWHWLLILRVLASMRRQVFAAAEDGAVSHVHALWVLPSGWIARDLARANGISYSVWALGSDVWSLGKIPVMRGLLARVSRDSKMAYADGIRLANDAKDISGRTFGFMPSSRLLDGQRARPVEVCPPYRFLYLGRWHRNKGVDLLFDALSLLDEEDWARIGEIHIAGGGPLDNLVHERARNLVRDGRPVRVSGFLGRQQAEVALANADRLLLPSRVESIPVVFSDALAFGLPVVSMPVGDLPHLLAKGGGWLADSVTASGFCAALRCALEPSAVDAEVLAELIDRFDIRRACRQLMVDLDGATRC